MPGKQLEYIHESVLLVKKKIDICLNHIDVINNNRIDAKYHQIGSSTLARDLGGITI